MATINRAPWDALIDDDGSNLVGSIWNKAAIKTVLLDPIDVAIEEPTWTDVPYVAGNYSWTVAAGNVLTHAYRRDGTQLVVLFYFSATAISGSPATLTFPNGSGLAAARYTLMPVAMRVGGVSAAGLAQSAPGSNQITILRDFAATAFPAGAADIAGTLIISV